MTQTAEQPSASDNVAAPASSAETVSLEVLPGVIGTPLSDPPAPAAGETSTPLPADAGGETNIPAPSDPAAAAPAPSKFTFGGVEYESQEKAEHSFKTLRGMHRALERKAEEQRMAALEERQRRFELEQRLAALETQPQRGNGKTGAEGQPAGDPEAEAASGPDWRVFEILVEKHGLPTAMRWLNQANAELVQKQVTAAAQALEKRFDERLAPFQATQAEQQEFNELTGLFESMATYTTEDGRVYYPELSQPEVMEKVGILWARMGFDKKELRSARGIHSAIANYRDSLAAQAARVTQAAPATTSQPGSGSPAAAAAAVGNGAEGLTPTRPPRPKTYEEQIRAETMAAAVSTNDLGFS